MCKLIKFILDTTGQESHPSKTFYFENESGNIIRFLFIDEKKAWQRKIAR